jgi:hypothetical protein
LVWLEFVTSVFAYGIPVIGQGAQQLSNYLIQGVKNKRDAGAAMLGIPIKAKRHRVAPGSTKGLAHCKSDPKLQPAQVRDRLEQEVCHCVLEMRREGNVTFAAYAAIRIRGAILDELLRQDSMSRWNLGKAKRLGSAVSRLKQEGGEQFLAGFSLVGFL